MNEEEKTVSEDAAKSAGECLSLALKYLSLRNRSVFDVREKLKTKGCRAESIEEVIVKLTDEGYLSDHGFAEELTRHRIDIKSWGRLKITADLQRHGIERETITEVISALCSDEEELSTATRALDKWLRIKAVESPLSADNKIKAMRHLASRGFTTETVRRALDTVKTETRDNS